MTNETKKISSRSPSRESQSEDRLQRMVHPKSLDSDEEQDWSGGRGTDVWAMLTAALQGDLKTVEKFVTKDPRLATCSYQYRTPLHFAVQENQIKVVQFLLEHGADAAYVSGNYWHMRPLVIAEERGYHELHQFLSRHLSEEAGVSSGGERIADAIRGRDVNAVRALLEAQPELIYTGDHRGNKPIHWAVMIRSMSMIDLVLEKGADINAMRPDGARALDLSHGDYFYRGWRDVPAEALLVHETLIGYLIARGAYTISR